MQHSQTVPSFIRRFPFVGSSGCRTTLECGLSSWRKTFVCRTSVASLSLQNALDYLECGLSKSYSTSSHALGIDLWRGRRCCSGNLQLPPLSQRQTEKAKTPDRDIVCRPTTLPLLTPPSIAITTYQDWWVISLCYVSHSWGLGLVGFVFWFIETNDILSILIGAVDLYQLVHRGCKFTKELPGFEVLLLFKPLLFAFLCIFMILLCCKFWSWPEGLCYLLCTHRKVQDGGRQIEEKGLSSISKLKERLRKACKSGA